MTTRTIALFGAGCAAVALTTAPAQAHPYGWRVGQDAAGDIEVDFLWQMTHKRFDARAGFSGVVDDGLMFEEWIVDDPGRDFYALDAGGKFSIEIVSFDAGVRLWDPSDLGAGFYNQPGQSYSLGNSGSNFLREALWQIDPTAPGFDLSLGIWEASFFFKDTTGLHGDSPVYTFRLQPAAVPAPAGACLIGAAGVFASRRRR